MKFVKTLNEFQRNFASRFSSSEWLEAIDFSKFAIVGGCLINALCDMPFPDTKQQDINLVYPSHNGTNFESDVKGILDRLGKISSKYSKRQIKIEKVPGSYHWHVILPCGVKLNIKIEYIGNSKHPISHITHNFDMDISQIAFTGKSLRYDYLIKKLFSNFIGNKLLCTFPFLQALATKCFITYSLHGHTKKHVCTRIAKYCARGFYLLEPMNFDGNFDILMEQEEIPLYRSEQRQIIDDEGEVQIVTAEYRRQPQPNIDTFQVQELFISMVNP